MAETQSRESANEPTSGATSALATVIAESSLSSSQNTNDNSNRAAISTLRLEGTYERGNSWVLIAMLSVSVLGFFVAAILVVEGVFALAGIGEELIRKDDPVLGFRHRPNKSVTWRREGFGKAAFTADGLFEEISAGAHPGIYRIAVFGDSMVEGLQEPQEQGFVKLLEKKMQGEVPGKLQIMNCGVFGYSTVQACLYADEIIDKYKPDLVLYGYDTRDMAESIETWVPPGQKPMGGRPYAIKRPGAEFEISSEPVINALQQDKSKFWAQFDWFQQNSRIWGYLSENRPKLSLHNALIDAIAGFGKAADKQKKPSFSIKFFEQNKAASANTKGGSNSVSDASKKTLTIVEQNQKASYLSILDSTFEALMTRLKKHCSNENAKLVVFAIPSRSDLLPDVGAAPSLYGVSFQDELQFVRKTCKNQNIPFLDCHENARTTNESEQRKLFFVLHLTPDGHKFISEQLSPFLKNILHD
ncbi:MAG: SGNH/GDSL hydrolase family protein [Candidatus Obscuribacterales bacterium]|jgi:hypothetical protein|nr:SGNH/GDSL hydrolase family protein [Candidatus Obscuribacterales bacterium]